MHIDLHLKKKNPGQDIFFRYWGKVNILTESPEEIIAKPLFLNEASFEEAFRKQYATMYRLVYQILRNKDSAEDVVQDVFVKLWNKRDAIQVTGSHKAYLCKTAVNAAYDHLRKYKKETQNEDSSLIADKGENETEKYLLGKETEAQIARAMEKLPPACRNVFILSREEELSYKEIAETLEISVKTVENQIGKALKILREELKPFLKEMAKLIIFFFISQ